MNKPRATLASGAHDDRRTRERVTSPELFRRIAAAFAALALGTGLALVAVAAPANAHHNDIEGVAACNTAGTYDITWTVTNSENLTEQITASSNTTVVPVGTEIGGEQTATFQQNGVDAGAYHLGLSAKWSNGQTMSNSGSVTAEGVCDDADGEVKKVTYCHATSSATNPYERLTTSVNGFITSGHLDHDGDIFPAFTYVKNGTTYHVAAQGDQALLAFEDCAEPKEEIPVGAAPSFSDTCGPDNEQLTVPTDTDTVEWSSAEADGSVTVIATAKPGSAFPEGAQVEWVYSIDDEPCPVSTTPTTPMPTTPTTPTPADITPAATTPTGHTLASTGFTGTTISIVAGVLLAAGVAFVVIAQVRRKRA